MADPKDRESEGDPGGRRRVAKSNTELRKNIVRLDERIDDLGKDIVEVRESVARLEGGMDHLVGAYHRTAEFAAQQASAELELRKSERLADIADKADEHKLRREVKRELLFKCMAVLTGLWAIIASALAAKC